MGALIVSAVPQPVEAIKIQPLLYNEQLEKGEVKKGFIDVSNPNDTKVELETSVQAFRQTDNDGTIEFFESEEIQAGIELDYDSFTLGPREAMRVVFKIDGSKLPSGDVFAALFVATKPAEEGQIGQSVRVGTLLILENGTPGAREASITGLESRFWQTGSRLDGTYSIKNDAKEGEATGFMPEVTITLTPFGGSFANTSSLVFAGRERANEFSYETNRAGLYYMNVKHGDSEKGQWVLLAPLWFIGLVIGLIAAVLVLRQLYKRSPRYKKR